MSPVYRVGIVSLLLSAALLALPAKADETFSVKEYDNMIATEPPNLGMRSPLLWFHLGMASGLHAAMGDYRAAGEMPLFCLPPDLAPWLSYGLVRSVIADELAARGDSWRRKPDTRIETVLVEGMRREYPCD